MFGYTGFRNTGKFFTGSAPRDLPKSDGPKIPFAYPLPDVTDAVVAAGGLFSSSEGGGSRLLPPQVPTAIPNLVTNPFSIYKWMFHLRLRLEDRLGNELTDY
jgi:hypothetical protein